jgi:hypothetical protein
MLETGRNPEHRVAMGDRRRWCGSAAGVAERPSTVIAEARTPRTGRFGVRCVRPGGRKWPVDASAQGLDRLAGRVSGPPAWPWTLPFGHRPAHAEGPMELPAAAGRPRACELRWHGCAVARRAAAPRKDNRPLFRRSPGRRIGRCSAGYRGSGAVVSAPRGGSDGGRRVVRSASAGGPRVASGRRGHEDRAARSGGRRRRVVVRSVADPARGTGPRRALRRSGGPLATAATGPDRVRQACLGCVECTRGTAVTPVGMGR